MSTMDVSARDEKKALVEYLNLACTGTGQATFYNTRKEQEEALEGLHKRLMSTDRRVYALTCAFPLNDKSRQLIIQNLLSTPGAGDFELEEQVIRFVADSIQFNRVLNTVVALCEKRVNNSRTRKLGRILWYGYADAYRVIKYRDKFRRILRHCHIPEQYSVSEGINGKSSDVELCELHKWVFGKIKDPSAVLHNGKLKHRLLAPKKYESCFELPFDIGRDIAVAHHGKSVEEFTKEFAGEDGKGKTTRKESLRARKTAGTEVDFNRFSMIELLMHLYRTPGDYGAATLALDKKASELADTLALPEKVSIVVDNSASARGSRQREFHPLAVIESTLRVCKALVDTETKIFYIGPPRRRLLQAEGASDLRMPLAKALASKPDLVLILSDGYENVRAGSVSQILNSQAVKNSGIAVIHLNPVAAAESGTIRKLADDLPTYGLTEPRQLPMAFLLGQAAADPALLAPMFDKIESSLKAGEYRKAKLAVGESTKRIAAPTGTT